MKEEERYADALISHKALHIMIHALNEQQNRSEYADTVLERLNDIDSYFNGKNSEKYHTVID